jgi:hypothetical protein
MAELDRPSTRARYLMMAVAVAVCAWPALASATSWGPGRDVLGPMPTGSGVLASDGRGDTALVGKAAAGITVAVAHSGTSFGRARVIPGSAGGASPRVRMDAAGDAVVVWEVNDGTRPPYLPDPTDVGCCQVLRVSVVGVHGRPGSARELSSRGRVAQLEAIGVGARHRFGLVWQESDEGGFTAGVRMRLGRGGRPLGQATTLGDDVGVVRSLRFAGDRVVLLGATINAPRRFVEERVSRAGHTLRTVGGYPGPAGPGSIEVLTDRRGGQAFATTIGRLLVVGTRRAGSSFRLRTLYRSAAHTRPALLGLAVSPAGALLVSWMQGRRVMISRGQTGGPLRPARSWPLPRRWNARESVAAVAIGDRGDGAIVLTLERRATPARLVALVARPPSAIEPAHLLDTADFFEPIGAGIDAYGRGVMAWSTESALRAATFAVGS